MSKKNKTSIDTQDLPVRTYTQSDFDWIHLEPNNFKEFPEKAIAELKNDYARIKAIPAIERTFENTVLALEKSGRIYAQQMHYVGFLAEVSTNARLRKAAHEVVEEYAKKMVDVVYDKDIYDALVVYEKKNEKLTGEKKILLNDTLRSYRHMGFDLPAEKQKALRKIVKELSKLSIAFRKNINEYKDSIVLTKEETVGLSERYLAGLHKDARGRYIVTLEYPDIGPFLENSPIDAKRKELVDKNARKGGLRNIAILKRMIELRHTHAALLGYKNFAQYAIEDRMAKNPETVMAFLNGIVKKLDTGVARERAELLDFKKRFTRYPKARCEYYDSYYINQLQKEKYALDNELVREYFPIERVRKGVFETYEKLLGIQFKKNTKYTLWDKDVELYEVVDQRKTIAYFAMDLFPREGKYGHAAAFDLINGREENGFYIAPFAALVCNFPKPSQNNPSLLSHDEVETFFHEFGHIMHDVLTKARYESQAGFHVAWDYVEMPSQMLENWAWKKEILKKISRHYKTKKPLPDMLIEKMLKAEKFRISTMYQRQMLLALFDMELHFKKRKGMPQEIYRKMAKRMLGLDLPKTQLFPAGFGHIGGGYEAGYYSYAWAKVYAQDMFSRFEQDGILNQKTGREYRTWILEKGSSMDEMTLIKKFLGRKPNSKAFFAYLKH
jgi:thimet oligopeptidase